MSVFVICPSARPIPEVLAWAAKWKARGYMVAVWRDNARDSFALQAPGGCDLVMYHNDPYPGYAVAVNNLVKQIMLMHADAEWFIPYGDDGYPDANHAAGEIAKECGQYFQIIERLRFAHAELGESVPEDKPAKVAEMVLDRHRPLSITGDTFGVMQPTGDRFGENPNHHDPKMRGAYIDRICGSAWVGREFCRRAYGGQGPLWPKFVHMFGDEHLQRVAQKLGILWQRRDLIHYHDHPGRKPNYNAQVDAPPHLKQWITDEHWQSSKKTFLALEAENFKETETFL